MGCLIPGCASIVEGSSQFVNVNTIPAGADCRLVRDGETIAVANPTPKAVTISKSRKRVDVTCQKPGYLPQTYFIESDTDTMAFGNLVLGGVVGLAVDAGTGALNRYDGSVTVVLAEDASSDHAAEMRALAEEVRKSVGAPSDGYQPSVSSVADDGFVGVPVNEDGTLAR